MARVAAPWRDRGERAIFCDLARKPVVRVLESAWGGESGSNV